MVGDRGCLVPPTVYFGNDSVYLNADDLYKIEQVATLLKANKKLKVTVNGHASRDTKKDNSYNEILAVERANKVKVALESMGIDASRMDTKSFGWDKPNTSNNGEEGWKFNRRVDYTFK